MIIAGYDTTKNAEDFWFDEKEANRYIKFIENFIHHVKGYDGKIKLEQWQKDITSALFGYKSKDGLRRYREAYIEIPRKNAKSTLCAAFALAVLLLDKEPGAEIISAAYDRAQSKIIFDSAVQMVMKEPALHKRLTLRSHAILKEDTNSVYKAISSEAYSAHGSSPSLILFDELHTQKDSQLWNNLTSGRGARKQPLVISLTTAGYNKNSLCYEKHCYAERVRDGEIIDNQFLPIIFSAKPEDDWTNIETWKKANPNYGVSVRPDYLAEECKKAKHMPSFENVFKRLYLNIWTEQDARWISSEKWAECATEDFPNPEDAECVYAGLDLATKIDFNALTLVIKYNGCLYLKSYFWTPDETLSERATKDNVPYLSWKQQGFLKATAGSMTDDEVIANDIMEIAKEWRINKIAVDPFQGMGVSNRLSKVGIDVETFRQGWGSTSIPAKEFEARIINSTLKHDNNPVLAYHVSCTNIQVDELNNFHLKKAKSRNVRNDGLMAAIMGIGLMLRDEFNSTPSTFQIDVIRSQW